MIECPTEGAIHYTQWTLAHVSGGQEGRIKLKYGSMGYGGGGGQGKGMQLGGGKGRTFSSCAQ